MKTSTPTIGRSETRENLAVQYPHMIRPLQHTRKPRPAANEQMNLAATPGPMKRMAALVQRLTAAAVKAWKNRATTVVMPINADTLAYEPGPGERKLIMNNRVVIIRRPAPE